MNRLAEVPKPCTFFDPNHPRVTKNPDSVSASSHRQGHQFATNCATTMLRYRNIAGKWSRSGRHVHNNTQPTSEGITHG